MLLRLQLLSESLKNKNKIDYSVGSDKISGEEGGDLNRFLLYYKFNRLKWESYGTHHMKSILSLIIGLILIATLWIKYGANPVHSPVQKGAKILAFGDSLTYGYGADKGRSYPSVLGKKTGIDIVNAGINAETSSDGLERLSSLLEDRRITHMILCYGGNDILRKLPMQQLKHNLKRMIELAQERGIEILLISVPDIGIFGLAPLQLYDEVADETGTPILSGVFSDILSDRSLKSDYVHPNARGYKKLAEKIQEKIRKLGWTKE